MEPPLVPLGSRNRGRQFVSDLDTPPAPDRDFAPRSHGHRTSLRATFTRVTRDEALAYCLAKPGAWLDEPWEGDEVVKVGDKIFAFCGSPDSDDPGVGLKCGRDAEEAAELRQHHPDSVTVSAYIGRYGWNSIRLGGTVAADEIEELIDTSYDAVLASRPKSKRPAS